MLKNSPPPDPERLTPRGRAFAYPDRGASGEPLPAAVLDERFPLEPDALKSRARAITGLDDFGPAPFDTPLARLCASLRDEVDLNAGGRESAYGRIMNILITRLRLQDLWRRHPEILKLPVRAPIFIVGLPRSGTTFLQWLLARDPSLRHAPFWELNFPLPDGDPAEAQPEPDPRIAKARGIIERLHAGAPGMASMHQLDAEEPEEELSLLALGFSSMAFEWSFMVPGYVDWYRNTDHTAGYAYFRRVLQTLQWLRGGEQWVLKAPMHMENLNALFATFPDATIVQTHRDPVTATVSLTSLTCYGVRNYFDHPDPLRMGSHIASIVERLLGAICAYRDRHGGGAFIDIQFSELMNDPVSAVRAIYAKCGKTLSPETERAMRTWIANSPRDKHGDHEYAAEDFGIDPEERKRALAFYLEPFGIDSARSGA